MIVQNRFSLLLNKQNLDSKYLKEIFLADDRTTFSYFHHLWITDNIPHAFKEKPWLYCYICYFLAERLHIHETDITMVGSAKLGYSLSPDQFCKMYNDSSDFDFTIINGDLFKNLCEDSERWLKDYESGKVIPVGSEVKYWPSNFMNVPHNLKRGFIDPYKIPNFTSYPQIMKFNQVVTLLKKKLPYLDNTLNSKLSFRVYQDWDAFKRQSLLNYTSIAKKIKSQQML